MPGEKAFLMSNLMDCTHLILNYWVKNFYPNKNVTAGNLRSELIQLANAWYTIKKLNLEKYFYQTTEYAPSIEEEKETSCEFDKNDNVRSSSKQCSSCKDCSICSYRLLKGVPVQRNEITDSHENW